MKGKMATKEIVRSDKAPQAIGPYSQGTKLSNIVFTAGQLGIDRATGELVPGGVEPETKQAIHNLQFVLEQSGSSLANVLKTTVFLRDMQDFPRMNAVYAAFFSENPPARSTVQVAGLPKGGAVEIEAIAFVN